MGSTVTNKQYHNPKRKNDIKFKQKSVYQYTNLHIGYQTEIRPKGLKSVSANKYHLIIADILGHCGYSF